MARPRQPVLGLDDEGVPVVKGVLETFGGTCPAGTVNAGGENPMVHVWIAPHECGPFAALEGHGAGQASVSDGARMDQCDHDHGAIDDRPRRPRDASRRSRTTPNCRSTSAASRASHRSNRPTPRTWSRRRSATSPSGPISTPSRQPASSRSATVRPVTSTTSSGTGSTTTSSSTPTTRRASCSSRSPTGPRSSCRRCS